MRDKLYHMGFRGKVARSTVADANDAHDWRIYADFTQVLIAIGRPLYPAEPMAVELEQSPYALDSTAIELCLRLFPWAHSNRVLGVLGASRAQPPRHQSYILKRRLILFPLNVALCRDPLQSIGDQLTDLIFNLGKLSDYFGQQWVLGVNWTGKDITTAWAARDLSLHSML
jgi:hypothetical protein